MLRNATEIKNAGQALSSIVLAAAIIIRFIDAMKQLECTIFIISLKTNSNETCYYIEITKD